MHKVLYRLINMKSTKSVTVVPMEKKILYAVLAVAIVVCAAVGIYVATEHDEENDSLKSYPGSYLAVLGNADLDDRITVSDAETISHVVEGGEYPFDLYMCDANHDGVVDGKDVEMVNAMVAAQSSGDWSAVGTVYYVNVDLEITGYDMTGGNKVITLIAPPLDSVLAMGGKDLVVGFDNRITTGKYHSEYASLFDFDKIYDVGDCNEPDTEMIMKAASKYGGVNVVCGSRDSYGPTLETVTSGSGVQVVRIASWEYGETMYGFMTLAYLLKMTDGAIRFYEKYLECEQFVHSIVRTVPASEKADFEVGAACVYGYTDELSLLGRYSGEHANLMLLDPYDSAGSFLGHDSGGHGETIIPEDISTMYQQYGLRHLLILVGAPFQVETGSGDAEATAASFKGLYRNWTGRIGTYTLPELDCCISGYSFSSGVAAVLNQLIHCYFMYNEEFLAYCGCETQKEAQDIIAGYVDWYCGALGIDGLWSFYGEDNGGKEGTLGMNLLYCGEGDERNIMYGPASGSTDVDGML